MAKTMCWFGWVKRLFNCDPNTELEKKSKKWKWVTQRFKIKNCPVIAAAPQRTILNEATDDERRMQALSVVVATAAAAEAAVAAANAAVEVVRLTAALGSYCPFSRTDRISAAVKIQSCFRGYLARKALRALKGIVRLQAIVRGRAVRRRIHASLNQPIIEQRRNSKVFHKRNVVAERSSNSCKKKVFIQPREEFEKDELKIMTFEKARSPSKKGMKALQLRKEEEIVNRERRLRYSFSHREGRSVQMAEESPRSRNMRSTFHKNLVSNEEMFGKKLGNVKVNSQYSFPRRSFCNLKHSSSIGDDDHQNYIPTSPVIPTYMAETESAKAKIRSISTPKQRLSFLNDVSFWSSYEGDFS